MCLCMCARIWLFPCIISALTQMRTELNQVGTLITGHSFIHWLNRYQKCNYGGKEQSRVFNVTHSNKIKLKGYPGEVGFGILNHRMKDVPKAEVLALDIGCTDIYSEETFADQK